MAAIKVRAKIKGDKVTVKALMSHPMQGSGQKDAKTGKEIPANYIADISAKHNGNEVLAAQWSGGISKNPYLSFKFSGAAKGDTITLGWTDINGKTASVDAKIK